METVWLNIDKSFNSTIASAWSTDGNYQICDLSDNSYQKDTNGEISYFTYCTMTLKKILSTMKESKKDLLITNFNIADGQWPKFEWLYLISMIMTLDPIYVGKSKLDNIYGISTNRFIQFDPQKNFIIDLKTGIENVKKEHPKSDVSEVVSIFDMHGMFLSFGSKFEKVIKLKDHIGLPISYEEFVQALIDERSDADKYPTYSTFFKYLSKIAIVREHNPVDLFIEKKFKSEK